MNVTNSSAFCRLLHVPCQFLCLLHVSGDSSVSMVSSCVFSVSLLPGDSCVSMVIFCVFFLCLILVWSLALCPECLCFLDHWSSVSYSSLCPPWALVPSPVLFQCVIYSVYLCLSLCVTLSLYLCSLCLQFPLCSIVCLAHSGAEFWVSSALCINNIRSSAEDGTCLDHGS